MKPKDTAEIAASKDADEARTERIRGAHFLEYLAAEVWPEIPPEHLGQPITLAEEDELLGFGPEGV